MDAIDKILYNLLTKYFKLLSFTGYKRYDMVYKYLVIDFIYDMLNSELSYHITNEDKDIMQNLLYQFYGSTCEVSLPETCCCNNNITIPTTISFKSGVADKLIVNGIEHNINSPIQVKRGETITLIAMDYPNYRFVGFYKDSKLISTDSLISYISLESATIELVYEKLVIKPTTTTTTPGPYPQWYMNLTANIPCLVSGSFNTSGINNGYSSELIGDGTTLELIAVGKIVKGIIRECTPVDTSHSYRFLGVFDNNNILQSNSLPFEWQGSGSYNLKFEKIEGTPPVVNTTTTTTTLPPSQVKTSMIYYGVSSLQPQEFLKTSIPDLINLSTTKSLVVRGPNEVEEQVPQDNRIQFLLIPKNKVNLIKAWFNSQGIITTFYDSSLEDIPNTTNNGAYFSKYTRGGKNAHQSGYYGNNEYDVYFYYNPLGGFEEKVNIILKNK